MLNHTDFQQLQKNLKKDFSDKKIVKIAILGDSATQLYNQALRALGFDYGFNLEIFESDFNQVEYQILTPNSELYHFDPDIIVIFQSTHKLLAKYDKSKDAERQKLATERIHLIKQFIQNIENQISSKIIYFNYPEIDDSVFGSYANKEDTSFLFQTRKLNYQLNVIATKYPNFFICDISSIQNQIGWNRFFQASIYINTEVVISLDALPLVAQRTLDIMECIYGKMKKCLILDLDNTVWGGVIGDDGLESIEIGGLGIGKAFTEFQFWVKKLKERGIILAVCSKNDESVAKKPFESHPDMVLRLDDFALFVANWNNKADNIKQIQQTLNIGFDSMVFLDDNIFERNIVRENIPGITVPELPEDPANYLEYLYSLNLFETTNYSKEDKDRTKQYQTEAKRIVEKSHFTDEKEYLKSLCMKAQVTPFNRFNAPRVAQLTQRSNQFNLRTIRYSENEILEMGNDNTFITLACSLKDKFGDNGLISVLILKFEDEKTLFIDTWLMSCRVLKRGVEDFILNTLVDISCQEGIKYLKGEYIPSSRNAMVKNFYSDLYFSEKDGFWFLEIDSYKKRDCYIVKEDI